MHTELRHGVERFLQSYSHGIHIRHDVADSAGATATAVPQREQLCTPLQSQNRRTRVPEREVHASVVARNDATRRVVRN